MNQIAAVFPWTKDGAFSHFAHFICDFTLPFYSMLQRLSLIEKVLAGGSLTLELNDEANVKFGPLAPLVSAFFPGLQVKYVTRFTVEPIYLNYKKWKNNPDHVQDFKEHLKSVLQLNPAGYGVIIVERGLDREKYPGLDQPSRSGVDRRKIAAGLEKLVAGISEIRKDCLRVVLEQLPIAEQISLFLNADTMIAQHGAAFAHAHWMPKGGHLIELQCSCRRLAPDFVPALAWVGGHTTSRVHYPCTRAGKHFSMTVDDITKVTALLRPKDSMIPIT